MGAIIDVDFREVKKEKSRNKVQRIKTEAANKFYNFKYRVKQKAKTVIEHPQETIATFAVLSVGYKFVKMIVHDIKPNSTDKLLKKRETQIYNPRTGNYIDLKHKMSSRQRYEYEQRRSRGESAYEALRAMNLIKR